MYKPKIAIIDSGVSLNVVTSQIQGVALSFGNGLSISENINDEFGHGTNIYGIITKHNPNADIFILKIYDNENQFPTISHLLVALKYLDEHIDCDIVNISLTATECISSETLRSLQTLCNHLSKKGKIIISAFSNDNLISYPAAFDSVIGVTSGEHCHRITDLEYCESGIVNFCALGSQQKVLSINGQTISTGNSLACAHVTGIASKLFAIGDNTESLIQKLKQVANKTIIGFDDNFKNISCPVKTYKRAIVFPLNKETQCLFRFLEMIPFSIVDIYDLKYSGYVGANIGKIINNSINMVIKNIEKIDYETFDTLIIGHVSQLYHSDKIRKIISDIVNNCIIRKKNIYSFEDIEQLVSVENKSKMSCIFTPDVKKENLYYAPMGKMFEISKPVLGVFGTGSKQGKFTLQLLLRKKFLDVGYKIGQISSEPSGYLFEMDTCFPFGYHSSTELVRHDAIAYLNFQERELCYKDVELIIVGCQSFVLPNNYNCLDRFPIAQLEFLYGTMPDAVVLCINAFDDIELINRSIMILESITNGKVIALVVSPIDIYADKNGYYHNKLSEKRYIGIREQLKQLTKLPIYRLDSNNDIEELCLEIIKYFAQ